MKQRSLRRIVGAAALAVAIGLVAPFGSSSADPSWAAEPVLAEAPSTDVPAPEEPASEEPAAEDPAPEDPAPEDPVPDDPAPEDPAPEDPAPENPAPEDPDPEDPAPEQPDPEDPTPEDPDVAPLPGQSDQPAPPTEKRLVLDHGHVDAFNPIISDEDGSLVLLLKEDVTGSGVLHTPETVALHVKSSARTNVPAGLVPGMPSDIYYLPLIQDQNLVWPGWDTQRIIGSFPEANSNIVVSEVDGPGEVFLWSTDTFGSLKSLMLDGKYKFPGTISQPYPAHTHANWGFTKPGSYVFTVRLDAEGSNGKKGSTQTAKYVFVVGDLKTTTTLEADSTAVEAGQAVTFTAKVATGKNGGSPAGAVQFRDTTSDTILGHTPVGEDGTAAFRTGALPPGEHDIVAEFVPSWSDTFTASKSAGLAVKVEGERIPKPEQDDTQPVGEDVLSGAAAGEGVVVTSPEKRVQAGSTVTARATDKQLRGDWISVWLHDRASGAKWLQWQQVDLAGNFTALVPKDQAPGEYRLVAKNRDGGFVGFDAFTVPKKQDNGGVTPPPKPKPEPEPDPVAPAQECQPAVTLDHGHIDAFTVSAGGGAAILQILEDVTGHRVLREVETVLLRVKEEAYTSIPAGVPGGPSGYVLPLAQNQNLIWPGWDTNRTTASGYTDVSINVTSVQGPGTVSIYTSQGSFGGWKPILTHGGYEFPGTLRESTPAHTHAQWVFSAKGVYQLNAYAVATNPSTGQSLTTANHTYVFQVGDVPLGDVFCSLTAHGTADSAFVNAAVNQAAEEAVAAEQAENAKLDKKKQKNTAVSAVSRREADGLEGILDGVPPHVLGVIIGGGVLMLGGIAGGTVWMLRRMRETPVE